MAISEFKTFAIGSGANVISPTAWATHAEQQTGFEDGIAEPNLANTVWRQSSFVTAMIGQFITDTLAQNAQDNGNLAQLEGQFIAAIQASVGNVPQVAFWHWGRDNGAANLMTVTTTPIIPAYADGIVVATIPNHDSTTTTPHLAASGLISTLIVRADGSPCAIGDIRGGTLQAYQYDVTVPAWRIIGSITIPDVALCHYGVDVGSANAMSVATVTPHVATVAQGMRFGIKKSGSSNTAATTLTIAGTAAAVTWGDGTPFIGGEWPANADGEVVFDGTYRLQGFPKPPFDYSVHYGLDTGTVNTVISTVIPPILSYIAGATYNIKIANNNTGATNVNLNGLGNVGVVLNSSGGALIGQEIKGGVNYFAEFLYDGTSMRLKNPYIKGISNAIGFTSIGAFTYTPPSNVTRIKVIVQAGGAAGRNVGGSSFNAGTGGGAGECRLGYVDVVPGVGIAGVVGAGAASGSNGNGGSSSFGAFITALGGVGTSGGTGGSGGFEAFPGGNGSAGFTNGNVTGSVIVIGSGGIAFFSSQLGNGGQGGDGGPSGNPNGRAGQPGIVLIEEIG